MKASKGNIRRSSRTPMRQQLCSALLLVLAICTAPAWAQRNDAQQTYSISAGNLADALDQLASESKVQIIYPSELVRGKRVAAISGQQTWREVLQKLLAGTGLTWGFINDTTIVIKHVDAAKQPTPQSPKAVGTKEKVTELEPIVVTGTSIRGAAPAGSPLQVYSREDIERSGAGTIDNFLEKLPNNYARVGQGTQLSSTSDARSNLGQGASVDIHGLGTGTTLILLNGHRLAPAGNNSSFVDISMLPTAAIERIDILSDGASAIYGSDAVGGVVNFVLRTDFDGTEAGVRFGSDGHGFEERRADVNMGKRWATGGVIASYQYYNRDALVAQDRSFSAASPLPTLTLLPKNSTHSAFFHVDQDLSPAVKVFGEALYGYRSSPARAFSGTSPNLTISDLTNHNKQVSLIGGLKADLSSNWTLDLSGNYGWMKTSRITRRTSPSGAVTTFPLEYPSQLTSVDLIMNGDLFNLPAGQVKTAVGLSWRHEVSISRTPAGEASASRNVKSAFGEVYAPILAGLSGSSRPLLEVSIAGRYDSYSDFGGAFLPKLGASSNFPGGFALRASWGKSYKAPSIRDVVEGNPSAILFNVPDPTAADGTTLALFETTPGNPDLKAERAQTWSAGIDYAPDRFPLKLSATYFNIKYKGRVASPFFDLFQPLTQPDVFAGIITRNPSTSVSQQVIERAGLGFVNAYGPFALADIGALINGRIANLATQKQSGVDFRASTWTSGAFGRLSADVNVTYMFELEKSITEFAPSDSTLGDVDSPTRLKGRATLAWAKGSLALSGAVNYVGSHHNQLITPQAHVDSWTTVDLHVQYDFPHQSGIFMGTSLSADTQNLFDSAPPFVDGLLLSNGYDGSNSNPIGRFLSLQIRKRF